MEKSEVRNPENNQAESKQPETMEVLREELKSIISGQSINTACRSIGISASSLSQFINNKYQIDKDTKVFDKINAFIRVHRERQQAPKHCVPFVMTENFKMGFETCRRVHLDAEIGVLYGEAGSGKTTLIKEYAKRYPETLLIEADLGYTTSILFRELHQAVGLDGQSTIHDMFTEVVNKLKGSVRLIIVDEAEHLPYRALDMLRRVYDKAGVGVLLVGLPRLIYNLRGRKGEYAQLYSRVGISVRLKSLQQADTEQIVHSVLPNSNGIWKEFHDHSKGNTRILIKMLMRAQRLSEINKCPVNKAIITETVNSLLI